MSKKALAYGFLIVVVCVSVFWTIANQKNEAPEFESATVERGSVLHTVSVTGHVEPIKRINLAFPVGGRISALPVAEGSHIFEDTVVAVLDGGIENAALGEAQARVEKEQAMLRDVTAPLRPEERAVKQAAITNAESAVERAKEAAWTALSSAFVYADDAVHEEADELFDNTQGGNPRFGITFSYGSKTYTLQADDAKEIVINRQRADIEQMLAAMQMRAENTSVDVGEALEETDNELQVIESFLTTLAGVINTYISDDSIDQSVYETFQTSIASARTAINTARSGISTAHTNYSTAQATLSLAERDLELSEAGASIDVIAAQEASLANALAAVGTAEERAQDNVLVAPIEGTISRVDYKVGEIVGPYEPVAELISGGVYEVEAYIPEADIARVRLGDRADITFDAFDKDDIFSATVVRIALSETYREGVPTYKTTLRLDEAEREGLTLRPGMTSDVEIYTDRKENTLFVPIRSVIREGNRSFVRIYQDGDFIEKDIETGLRGSEGTIEIISGLSEGEEIVLYIEES